MSMHVISYYIYFKYILPQSTALKMNVMVQQQHQIVHHVVIFVDVFSVACYKYL